MMDRSRTGTGERDLDLETNDYINADYFEFVRINGC